MSQPIRIKSIVSLTHDVLQITTEKPNGFTYSPGQAADISIPQPGWENELRAFTFTSLPSDDFLEFTIKTYPEHKGVTHHLRSLSPGDQLLVHEPFGDIKYQGEGLFLAGGAGITPFIAIFRQLEKEGKVGQNTLIFANKTSKDIIQHAYFTGLLEDKFIHVLSDEENKAYEHGFITADLIKKHIFSASSYFYLCGPAPMMEAVEKALRTLGIAENHIIKEGF